MTDRSFSEVIASMAPSSDGIVAPVSEAWTQGRTTYGGYTVGMLLGAVQATHTDLPPVRSALVNFTGPVSAPPRLTSRVLRAGRNVTTIAAEADIDGSVVATATFSFGAPIDHDLLVDLPAPLAPAPDECAPYIPENVERFVPKFQKQFDTRLIDGARPYSGT